MLVEAQREMLDNIKVQVTLSNPVSCWALHEYSCGGAATAHVDLIAHPPWQQVTDSKTVPYRRGQPQTMCRVQLMQHCQMEEPLIVALQPGRNVDWNCVCSSIQQVARAQEHVHEGTFTASRSTNTQ